MKSGLQEDTNSYVRVVVLIVKDEWPEKMFDCKCVKVKLLLGKFKYERLRMSKWLHMHHMMRLRTSSGELERAIEYVNPREKLRVI